MINIEEAITDYADRAGSGGGGSAPYNSESLAEIYGDRVRQLIDLQNQGFTHAEWKWDADAGCNHWHGVADTEPDEEREQIRAGDLHTGQEFRAFGEDEVMVVIGLNYNGGVVVITATSDDAETHQLIIAADDVVEVW